MGLGNVLGTALSGLQVTQSSIEIVSQNIANSTTKGYTRKLHDQDYVDANGSNYVRSLEATRALDVMLQRSVRQETARMGETEARNGLQSQLGLLFGQPGSNIALDTMFNDVVEALEGLVTTPESNGARQEVLSQAQSFAARLNQLSDGVQELRRQAEVGIAEGVREANDALQEIERLDAQIVMETGMGRVDADLLDQRDIAIDRLNGFMEVRTFEKGNGGVSVMTTGGVMLHDIRAVEISFDSRRSVSAQQLYDRDDAQRGVGTITIGMPDGAKLDLLSFDGMRGGRLAGLVDMRDTDLVEAQAQLDEIAHALAKATQTTPASVAPEAPPAVPPANWQPTYDDFSLDLTGFAEGDTLSLTFQNQKLHVCRAGRRRRDRSRLHCGSERHGRSPRRLATARQRRTGPRPSPAISQAERARSMWSRPLAIRSRSVVGRADSLKVLPEQSLRTPMGAARPFALHRRRHGLYERARPRLPAEARVCGQHLGQRRPHERSEPAGALFGDDLPGRHGPARGASRSL